MTMPPAPATLNPYGTAGEPAVSGLGTGGTAATGSPPAPSTPTTPTTRTGPAGPAPLNIDISQIKDPATRGLIQGLIDQEASYGGQISTALRAYQDAAQRLNAADTSDLNYHFLVTNADSSLATWQSAQNNLARLHESIAATIQKAIDTRSLEPQWAALADKYTADAAQIRQQTQSAAAAAPAQRGLLVAQASQASAQAALDNANAAHVTATISATINQLQAQANQANAAADEAAKRSALLGAQLPTAGRAAEASTAALETAAAKAKREVEGMLTPEQVAAKNAADVASAQLDTATKAAGLAKAQQGPLYGLPEQLAAIQQITQGVKNGTVPWSGDPAHLDTLLSQYLSASIGGTTPAAAATTAAGAQATTFGQQLQQRQQDVGLAQSQLGTFGSLANQGLSTIAAMNPMAAIGSTEGARALGGYVQSMLGALKQPQFQAPAQLQAPSLPPFLQNFAAPQPAASTASQAPVVHINIGAGAPSSSGGAAPATAPPGLAPAPFAQSGVPEGSSRGGMPAFLQGKMPATPNDVMALYPQAAARAGMA